MPCKFCKQKTNDLQLLWMKRFIDPFIPYPLVNECLTHWQHKHSGISTLNEGCTWTICAFSPLSKMYYQFWIMSKIMSQIHEAKGSGSKLHCRKRRVINLKSHALNKIFQNQGKSILPHRQFLYKSYWAPQNN